LQIKLMGTAVSEDSGLEMVEVLLA
jgi:hypothetical protein